LLYIIEKANWAVSKAYANETMDMAQTLSRCKTQSFPHCFSFYRDSYINRELN